jgi:xanthine dehydrogenase YagS FAD-binding subunit
MAVIHDMMPAFELFQPRDVEGALALMREHGSRARVLSGGLDTWDWLKDRAKRPEVLIDIGGIEELRTVNAGPDGVEIGALASLSSVVKHPEVAQRYGLLAKAAEAVATPQIRNQGTIGGNIAQDTRCTYYRNGWPCYRAGGNICYAAAPRALNREHAILGADRCVAVSPSDTAPALIALDAKMVVRNRRGEREIDAANFFIGPGTDITRMTVLRSGDLLTAIRIPSTWANAQFYWEKVTDRKAWDFPLVNVASAMVVENGTIRDSRIVLGAVAAKPLRLHRVERAIAGRPANEETAQMAGELAVRGAKTLRFNGYKVPLAKNLVKRAIRGEEA